MSVPLSRRVSALVQILVESSKGECKIRCVILRTCPEAVMPYVKRGCDNSNMKTLCQEKGDRK